LLLGAQLAAADLFIRDILDTPSKYFNLTVQLQGEVTNVVAPQGLDTRGYYTLIDNSDKTIRVVANTLPAPQEKLVVSGVVQVEPETQTAYLREISRGPIGATLPPIGDKDKGFLAGLSPTILILIGLIAVVLIVLLVVMLKPKAAPAPVQAAPAMPGPQAGMESAPAKPVVPGTRQVTMAEVNARVGGVKTTQVPSLLAELKVMTGALAGKSFPLRFETIIGRVSGDIILDDSSVSKEHARIIFAANKYVLENRSSTNPVILNGDKVAAQKELKDNDEIICGFIKMQFKLI
jgi:hypothetical protein